jgi:hypothetical protein
MEPTPEKKPTIDGTEEDKEKKLHRGNPPMSGEGTEHKFEAPKED